MTNKEILEIALRQSAIDCACEPEDFLKDENTLTLSRATPYARRYLQLPHMCNFVSYGRGIVATAGEEYQESAERCLALLGDDPPYRLFETPNLQKVEEIFAPLDGTVRYMAEYFLPDTDALSERECPLELKILEPPAMDPYYSTPEFKNALSQIKMLDVMGAGAFDGGRLVGLAACSADCETMWQIGVDVLPEYRRRGIASALTSRLAAEILKRGRVPFYCAAWSNVASVRNAVRSGFRPAWVELALKRRPPGEHEFDNIIFPEWD